MNALLASRLLAPLALAAATTAQTWTTTAFGPTCGGTLQVQVVQHPAGNALRVGITGADPLAHAVLVLGHQFATPVALPGGCSLLVEARVMLHARTSRAGSAGFHFRLPPIVPITIDLQGLVITATPTGRIADSTNGVRVVGS